MHDWLKEHFKDLPKVSQKYVLGEIDTLYSIYYSIN
jgi:hypothetical protein